MGKEEFLLYEEYEKFYEMAEVSSSFRAFCRDAFGEDFSQDGFSDIKQIDLILQYVPQKEDVHILDIGCGNGKMLGYLQERTGAYIYGFDYSENGIRTAQKRFQRKAEFKEGIIGQVAYPEEMFDIVISMDTMYFAKDMTAFVSQIKGWLKKDGVFFVGYQEGDVLPRTENADTSILAGALKKNGMNYRVTDLTEQTYNLLKKKRMAAMAHQAEFEAEGYGNWFDVLMGQTDYVNEQLDEFKKKMARYIYVAKKP